MTQKILAAIIHVGKTIMAAAAMYFVISIVPLDVLAFTAPISSPDVIMFAAVATVGTAISQEPLIYRGEIPALLRAELGVVVGKSTLAKLFSPAVGQGCEPAAFWNRRPLYRRSDILTWAKSRLRPGPAAMSADGVVAESVSEPEARTRHEESLTATSPP